MIEYKNVSFSYLDNGKTLDGINLTINPNETVGIIGANGAGKSTLLKSLVGLISVEGEIKVNGLTLEKKNLPEIRKLVGYVIQESDNQMFMPTVIDDMVFGPINYGMDKKEAITKAEEALSKLGISGLRNKHNHRISGGEKKMAALATILTMEPEVLLMDEPSASLDPRNRRNLINVLNGINKTKIIASHDLDFILDTCDRVILLNDGHIVADGNASELLRDEVLLESNSLELPFCLQGR